MRRQPEDPRKQARARDASSHDAQAAARRAHESAARRSQTINRLIEKTSELKAGSASFALAAKKVSDRTSANPLDSVSDFFKRTFTRNSSPESRATDATSSSSSSSSASSHHQAHDSPPSSHRRASALDGASPWSGLLEEEEDDDDHAHLHRIAQVWLQVLQASG